MILAMILILLMVGCAPTTPKTPLMCQKAWDTVNKIVVFECLDTLEGPR